MCWVHSSRQYFGRYVIGMDIEERVTRALRLPEPRLLAFTAAAAEHLSRTLQARLAEGGFDEIAASAVEALWAAATGPMADDDTLSACEQECFEWAPDTEDVPEWVDSMYALIALAYACRVARNVETQSNLRDFVADCDEAVTSFAAMVGEEDESNPPELVEEVRYQSALLSALETIEGEIDRAALLAL